MSISRGINLGYTQIHAPIDGKTGPILIQPGKYDFGGRRFVGRHQSGLRPSRFRSFCRNPDLPRIQARQKAGGLTATIDLRAAGGENLTTPVYFPSATRSTIVTGTIELRASDANVDAALVPGQLVNVVVELSNIRGATVIPHQALNAGPDGQYVYVVADGKAQLRPVKVLFDDTTHVAIDGDIKPGDQVVVEGQLQIAPGGGVQVVRTAPAAAAPQSAGTVTGNPS